jgi:CubicO group peptidase (beta-lactamase class C family)
VALADLDDRQRRAVTRCALTDEDRLELANADTGAVTPVSGGDEMTTAIPQTGTAPVNGLKRYYDSHHVGSASYEEIDAYIERQMDRLNIPGAALAIVAGDKIVHLRGFGQARPGGEAPSPQTPFFLGSTTKSITALAVMQLVEAGKIALDAPVQTYLPWFRIADPQASAQMTVRHLLNQTSGLPLLSGWIPLADCDESPGAGERQARALATLALRRPVGSAFEYSNTNYNLLGLIIEAASGESYEAYIQNHIFAPLEMRHSFTSRTAAAQHGLAVGHRYWFSFPIAATGASDQPFPRGSIASGQLISSAEDMANYLIAHLNEGRYGDVHILSPAGIAELHRPATDTRMMDLSIGQYAMGWFNEKHGQTRILSHTGIVPDFFAYMALLPEQKKGVMLLINADHFLMTVALTEVGMGVSALLAGAQPARSKFGRIIPWALRGLLLIPALQIVDMAATLRLLRRWRQAADSRPRGGQRWGRYILLPLILDLLVALSLIPMRRRIGGFLRLFLPDGSWIALRSGSFGALWAILRTGLILWTLRTETESARPGE